MSRTVPTLLLALATLTAACSDDTTGPVADLSEAERTLLAQSLLTIGFQATGGTLPSAAPSGSPDGPSAADVSYTFDTTVPCPVSGDVAVSGSLDGTADEATGDVDVDYSMEQTHRACVVRSEDGATELRIDGEPGTTFVSSFTSSGQGFSADGQLTGGVRYTVGDRTGVCATSLSWSGSGDFEGTTSFSLSGSVCGTEISTTVSDG